MTQPILEDHTKARNVKKGKVIGRCEHCDLWLATYDKKTAKGIKCPRCGEVTEKPVSTKPTAKKNRTTEEIFANVNKAGDKKDGN